MNFGHVCAPTLRAHEVRHGSSISVRVGRKSILTEDGFSAGHCVRRARLGRSFRSLRAGASSVNALDGLRLHTIRLVGCVIPVREDPLLFLHDVPN